MKTLWVPILLLVTGSGVRDEKLAADDEKGEKELKSGEVTQIAFTSDGKNLVVVNEFRRFGNLPRQKSHSRLRRFSTSDWKTAVDTDELSLIDVNVAPSGRGTWLVGARDFDRYGRGNPDNGPVFYKLDPITLKLRRIDVIGQGRDNVAFSGTVIACSSEKPLCVVHLVKYLSPRPFPEFTFVFDLKVGKKTVDLRDCPTGQLVRGDFAGLARAFSPDAKQIASSSPYKPYQMQLHDANTGKLLKSMKVKSPVGEIQFSPDGKLLAAMCQDGTLLILHPDISGHIHSKKFQAFTFEKYGGFPKPIAFVGDGHLAVIASDTSVELLDTKEWKSVRALKTRDGERNRVNCVAGSPDGKLLVVGFGRTDLHPGLVRVWETDTGKLVKELK